ncbi:MAG: DUF1064 domain-containing protein [Candidatus Paceibacterota bacterium]|jgi:hypothetical protein
MTTLSVTSGQCLKCGEQGNTWGGICFQCIAKGYEPLKGNKYGAIRTEHNGRVFASKGEAARARELELRQQAGEISNLEYQVRYPLKVNGQLVGHYVADFVYQEDGQKIVEDFKGRKTPIYNRSKKMMKAIYGIEIRETSR